MLLSDIYSPLFFWIHQVNYFFLFCGFYGNNTTTQLGLIQPCRSQSLSNSWTQHVSHRKKRAPANLDETPIKLLFDPLFISELSATLTKERAAWNKSITCSSLVFWFFFSSCAHFSPDTNQLCFSRFFVSTGAEALLSVWQGEKHITVQTFLLWLWLLVPILLLATTSLLGVVAL